MNKSLWPNLFHILSLLVPKKQKNIFPKREPLYLLNMGKAIDRHPLASPLDPWNFYRIKHPSLDGNPVLYSGTWRKQPG